MTTVHPCHVVNNRPLYDGQKIKTMSATKAHHHDTIEAAQRPKQRPILFNTEMVRAILEGRKTQSRRIIKKLHPAATKVWHDGAEWIVENELGKCWLGKLKCPYGRPGDRLLVRETWTRFDIWKSGPEGYGRIIYRADGEKQGQKQPWYPSIHMPLDAVRLILEITDIRAERLHDITEADAVAEGFPGGGDWESAPTTQFFETWEKINGREALESDPWVWVITFNRIKT